MKKFWNSYTRAFLHQCTERKIMDVLHQFWEHKCDVRVQAFDKCTRYNGSTGKLITSSKWALLRKLLKQLMICAKGEPHQEEALELDGAPAEAVHEADGDIVAGQPDGGDHEHLERLVLADAAGDWCRGAGRVGVENVLEGRQAEGE